MKNNIKILVAVVLAVLVSGCSSLGQEDFTCSNLKKNGVCAGPRDIYEMTNNRDSLEGLTQEELDRQRNRGKAISIDNNVSSPEVHGQSRVSGTDGAKDNYVYVPRDQSQHTAGAYQTAKLAPQQEQIVSKQDEFARWPANGEPLAPEALALMEEPKPLRIMVNSYTDANGVFHVPGYAYVNTQRATWIKGGASEFRPTRVVPLELRQQSQEQMQRVQRQRQGVSPLGILRGDNSKDSDQP